MSSSLPASRTTTSALDMGGVLPHGSPQARFGLAFGQVLGGIVTLLGGVTGEVIGGIATTTGIGAAVGVPTIVVSTTFVVGGFANIAAGLSGLSQAAMSQGSGSGSGTTPPKVNGETAATQAGRQEHKAWNPGKGFQKEVQLPSGKRPDAVNWETRQVKGLKPDNPAAIRRGQRQVERYRKELEEMTGRVLDRHRRDIPEKAMSKTTNPIRLALEAVLSGEGFSRKGDSWYRRNNEVVEVVNLQKSQYGDQHYLNYALWLTTLGDATFPKEEKCHIRMRVDITMTDAEQFARLLDLETHMPADERRTTIAALLTSEFIPFADRCRSLAELHALFANGRFRNAMVLVAAKRALIS